MWDVGVSLKRLGFLSPSAALPPPRRRGSPPAQRRRADSARVSGGRSSTAAACVASKPAALNVQSGFFAVALLTRLSAATKLAPLTPRRRHSRCRSATRNTSQALPSTPEPFLHNRGPAAALAHSSVAVRSSKMRALRCVRRVLAYYVGRSFGAPLHCVHASGCASGV